jgi:hypothetical protein
LSDVLGRLYQNQLALEAALMELTLHVEAQAVLKPGMTSEVLCGPSVRTPGISNRV